MATRTRSHTKYSPRVGDIVWAKLASYSFWPSMIEKINTKSRKAHVLFYGTNDKGSVKFANIRPYREFRDDFAGKKLGANFQRAVKEGDEKAKSMKDAEPAEHLARKKNAKGRNAKRAKLDANSDEEPIVHAADGPAYKGSKGDRGAQEPKTEGSDEEEDKELDGMTGESKERHGDAAAPDGEDMEANDTEVSKDDSRQHTDAEDGPEDSDKANSPGTKEHAGNRKEGTHRKGSGAQPQADEATHQPDAA